MRYEKINFKFKNNLKIKFFHQKIKIKDSFQLLYKDIFYLNIIKL
jgi:hypothetical protein